MKKLIILLALLGFLLTGCVGPQENDITDEEKEKIEDANQEVVEVIKEYHYLIRENDTMFPHDEYEKRGIYGYDFDSTKEDIIALHDGMLPTYIVTGKEYRDSYLQKDSILNNRELYVYDNGLLEWQDNRHIAHYFRFVDGVLDLVWEVEIKDKKVYPEYLIKEED